MKNNLDTFFKNKLAEHEAAPRTEAWSKVEAGLTKKNKKLVWFKAAAVLVMGGLAASLWYMTQTHESVQPAITQSSSVQNAIEDKTNTEVIDHTEVIKKQEPTKPVTKVPIPQVAQVVKQGKENKKKEKVTSPTPPITMNMQVAAAGHEITNELPEIKSTQAIQPKAKSIVLVYTLPEVSQKKNSTPEADLVSEKKSGFKKVLEIASEVRNGESPLGNLRQAKNELFAFNFKKEKNERDNK